jgi:hypothetical protein
VRAAAVGHLDRLLRVPRHRRRPEAGRPGVVATDARDRARPARRSGCPAEVVAPDRPRYTGREAARLRRTALGFGLPEDGWARGRYRR